jgi:hypothetical protein
MCRQADAETARCVAVATVRFAAVGFVNAADVFMAMMASDDVFAFAEGNTLFEFGPLYNDSVSFVDHAGIAGNDLLRATHDRCIDSRVWGWFANHFFLSSEFSAGR